MPAGASFTNPSGDATTRQVDISVAGRKIGDLRIAYDPTTDALQIRLRLNEDIPVGRFESIYEKIPTQPS